MLHHVKRVTVWYLYLAGLLGGLAWLAYLIWVALTPPPTLWETFEQHLEALDTTERGNE